MTSSRAPPPRSTFALAQALANVAVDLRALGREQEAEAASAEARAIEARQGVG